MTKPWKIYKAAQRAVPMERCARCGSTSKLQRHHADYGKPLDVEVLCQSCRAALLAAGMGAQP